MARQWHRTLDRPLRWRRYEAVEPFEGWRDLEQRLYPNRQVHAFFHPTLPGEPLVILHAALRSGVASTVAEVLNENRNGALPDAPVLLGSPQQFVKSKLPHWCPGLQQGSACLSALWSIHREEARGGPQGRRRRLQRRCNWRRRRSSTRCPPHRRGSLEWTSAIRSSSRPVLCMP